MPAEAWKHPEAGDVRHEAPPGGEIGPSPTIVEASWGEVVVEDPDGTIRRYKDAKLFPGGSREWDWRETGMRHDPGVQVRDVEELLDRGAGVVVIARGFHRRLGVCDGTVERLEGEGAQVHVLETGEAARRYGALREGGAAVGGLFHSTC